MDWKPVCTERMDRMWCGEFDAASNTSRDGNCDRYLKNSFCDRILIVCLFMLTYFGYIVDFYSCLFCRVYIYNVLVYQIQVSMHMMDFYHYCEHHHNIIINDLIVQYHVKD